LKSVGSPASSTNQYILRPGGAGDIDNALVIGAKISVNF
jgi:carbohydrate-selective porin OprB